MGDMSMSETLILFETAKLAKEKGFTKVWCNNMYYIGFNNLPEDKEIIECDWRDNVDGQFHLALAPTQSLLQKWLREKHNLHITIAYGDLSNKYMGDIMSQDGKMLVGIECIYDTYEEALEAGLQEALKLI